MVKKKNRRKAIKEMFDAVEAGESYTILKAGKPAAIVLPIADWHALRGGWLDLLKPMRDDSPLEHVMQAAEEVAEPDPTQLRRVTRAGREFTAYAPPGIFATADPGPRLMTPEEAQAHRAAATAVSANPGQGGAGGGGRNPFTGAVNRPNSFVSENPGGAGGSGTLSATVMRGQTEVVALADLPADHPIRQGTVDLASIPVTFSEGSIRLRAPDGHDIVTVQREQPIQDHRTAASRALHEMIDNPPAGFPRSAEEALEMDAIAEVHNPSGEYDLAAPDEEPW